MQYTVTVPGIVADQSVLVTETVQFTKLNITDDNPTPAATLDHGSSVSFAIPINRVLDLAATDTLTSTKPLGAPTQPFFSVLHTDYFAPFNVSAGPPTDVGPVTNNAGGTVPVSFTDKRSSPKLFYEVSDDRQYIVNRADVNFSNAGGGIVITVVANYTFGAAAPAADSVSILVPFPEAGEPLLGTRTPVFTAAVNYTLGSKPKGEVSLQITDKLSGGSVLAFSDFNPGARIATGSGTIGTSGSGPPLKIAPFNLVLANLLNNATATYNSVFLSAVLTDTATGNTLKTSSPIEYKVQPGSVKLTADCVDSDLSAVPLISASRYGDNLNSDASNGCAAGVRAQYRLTESDAVLSLLIYGRSGGVDTLLYEDSFRDVAHAPGDTQSMVLQLRSRPDFFGSLVLKGKLSNSISGQTILSEPLVIPVQSVRVGSCIPDFSDPNSLLNRAAADITCGVRFAAQFPGLQLVRYTRAVPSQAAPLRTVVATDLPVGEGQNVNHSTPSMDPEDEQLAVSYRLESADGQNQAQDFNVVFENFTTIFNTVAGAAANFVAGTVSVVQGAPEKAISVSKKAIAACELAQFLGQSCAALAIKYLQGSGGKPAAVASARTQASGDVNGTPGIIGIYSGWTFDPAIPRDGSFLADLTLNYGNAVLPADDPNFVNRSCGLFRSIQRGSSLFIRQHSTR